MTWEEGYGIAVAAVLGAAHRAQFVGDAYTADILHELVQTMEDLTEECV